jgi:hypothetical protein
VQEQEQEQVSKASGGYVQVRSSKEEVLGALRDKIYIPQIPLAEISEANFVKFDRNANTSRELLFEYIP